MLIFGARPHQVVAHYMYVFDTILQMAYLKGERRISGFGLSLYTHTLGPTLRDQTSSTPIRFYLRDELHRYLCERNLVRTLYHSHRQNVTLTAKLTLSELVHLTRLADAYADVLARRIQRHEVIGIAHFHHSFPAVCVGADRILRGARMPLSLSSVTCELASFKASKALRSLDTQCHLLPPSSLIPAVRRSSPSIAYSYVL